MANKGIDYGRGLTNIDHETGIRYGVISAHAIGQVWYDESEAQYGDATCPKCGNDARELGAEDVPDEYDSAKYECAEYACDSCQYVFGSESAYGDEPLGYTYDGEGYRAESCLDSDVIVTKSDYYTYGPYCSPCVPGAVSLPDDEDKAYDSTTGDRAYCFGHDWFEGGKAPYRVYRVSDNSEVLADDPGTVDTVNQVRR